jgi:hypothetical protein
MSDVPANLHTLTAPVEARLAALRSSVQGWFWVAGLYRLLWLALLLAAVDLGLDWLFRMDLSQRVVMLVLIVGALAYAAYHWLVVPLSCPMSDDALCLEVERKHPALGQSLISALQLARLDRVSERGMSPALVKHTVHQGAQAASDLNFTSVLDAGGWRRNMALLVLGVAAWLAVGIGVARSAPLSIWFNRNVLLGEAVWPQNTYLVIERAEGGKVTFPRGGDWTQIVSVREDSLVVPDAVYLDFRSARSRPTQAMKKVDERTFEALFNNVLESFEFRARGGDDVTEWVRVELVEPPAVEELAMVVTLPKYAGGEEESLPPGKGPYYILKGSSLTLQGTANKPLQSAALVVEGKSTPLGLAGETEFRGRLSAAELTPGQYVVELVDTLGLTNRRPATFGLRLKTDREPRVRARLVGIGGMVVPKARIPLTARVSDDFGVTEIHVAYAWRGDEATGQQGQIKLDEAASQLPARELAFDDAFELEPLQAPVGTALTFSVTAIDNDEVSGAKPGKSSDFLVRVVTEEELRTDLLRREKEQRQEFERLAKLQDEILTDTRALAAEVKDAEEIASQPRELLIQLQRRQKLIGVNTSGVADRLESIVVEVLNNRLEDEGGKLERRLREDILAPMRKLVEEDVPAAVGELDETRRVSSQKEPRTKALEASILQQEAIAETMRQILTQLVKSEGYQEAVNLLLEIQKSQQDVFDRTLKEKQERLKGILERPNKSEGGEKPEESGKPATSDKSP